MPPIRTQTNIIGLPSIAAVILGILAGAAQVVNEVVLNLSPEWHSYVAIMLVFIAGIGISPLVGPAFRAALHLPVWAGYLISAAMAAAVLALASTTMSGLAHSIIAAVLTILSALGFAPANIPPSPQPEHWGEHS